MKWLLDTNVISEQVKPRPNRSVLDWLARCAPERVAISIVTLAELRSGALSMPDENRRNELMRWLDEELSAAFGAEPLPLTIDILVDWLQLSQRLAAKGQGRTSADLLIAATARVHDLILVTGNVRDFGSTGLILYDPWTGKTHNMHGP